MGYLYGISNINIVMVHGHMIMILGDGSWPYDNNVGYGHGVLMNE